MGYTPRPRFSRSSLRLPFSPSPPTRVFPSFEIGQGYRPTRRERRRRRIRVFRLLATPSSSFRPQRNARRWRRRVWDQPGPPYTFKSPPRPGSSAAAAALSSVDRASPRTSPRRFPRARLLLHSYPSPIPTMVPFIFVLAFEDAPTSMNTYDTSVDSIFIVPISLVLFLYFINDGYNISVFYSTIIFFDV